jgi:LuxR family maltose regulon positive regulatory protein
VYLRLGWVLAEWNDLDGFYSHVSRGVVLADQIGYDSVVIAGSKAMAWEKELLAQQGIAIEFPKEVAGIVERVTTLENDTSGMPDSPEGNGDITIIEAQYVDAYLADDAYFEVWPGYSEHGRARRLADEGRVEEALDLLARIYESAQAVDGIGLMIEARTTEALICQAQGDIDRALDALGDALILSEPEGYIRTYADRHAPMAQLLHEAAVRGMMPDYVSTLLSAFGTAKKSDTESPPQSLIEPLSPRELEVLELISQGLSNREIAGRLFVALTTVKGHNSRIFGKLQAHRRTEAVARARELGLL